MYRPIYSLILIALIAAAPSSADDLKPPDYRDLPKALVAGWDFLTDQDIYAIRPDAIDVPLRVGDAAQPLHDKFPARGPYPLASTFGDLIYTEEYGGGYYSISSGENGLVFTIPGWLEPSPRQELRVQVAFQGEPPMIAVKGLLGIPGNTLEVQELPIMRVPLPEPFLPPGSSFIYEDWLLSPSPTWQQVFIFLPTETFLLSVTIDTLTGTHPLFENGYEDGE